ncbi:hypothetical protein RhiirA5_440337 [Rhizophagus irregularis]|uniref:Uncharacterized protein n=1 Tax=Rhizophagus irregularis TaxID=588596 RepID=A0A2N0NGS9_9GLOM|nr:hypothetical protein RhiirA5_440337 [Rhizophagus irregularis]
MSQSQQSYSNYLQLNVSYLRITLWKICHQWLINNQNDSNSIYLIRHFNFHEIGTYKFAIDLVFQKAVLELKNKVV